MKRLFTLGLTSVLAFSITLAQTPSSNPQQDTPQDVVRISASLVQTDVVVVDKNERVIPDLTINDFKVFDGGKRQEIQFLEFVNADGGPRTEGNLTIAGKAVEAEAARNLTVTDLRRVMAFVVDDLTIPVEDMISVRNLLTNFVDNQMRDGDLVAIVRVVGGGGLLQQFTSDKRILRRAIEKITPRIHPYSALSGFQSPSAIRLEVAQAAEEMNLPNAEDVQKAAEANLDASDDGVTKGLRSLSTLTTASDVINSMKELPGRKSLMLLSGGLPLYEQNQSQVMVEGVAVTQAEAHSFLGNVSYVLRQLTDRASRAGVVINTMDVRGLKASRGVAKFTDPGNEGTSGLLGGMSGGGGPGFGRQPNMATFDNLSFDTLSGHMGLQVLADTTGGVAVTNSDNFSAGLDKVLARSSYYLIAYRPSEAFDGKYHKLEIKVERPGAKVYTRKGYFATADSPTKALTREQALIKAAMSPLARRDLNFAGNIQYRFTPENRASIDLNLVIDPHSLDFTESGGKHHAKFDVVGFVMNSVGKAEDGFSQTVTAAMTPQEYQRALANGVSFTGTFELPPGVYQLRAVVSEPSSGRLGTVSQYLEIPDLAKKRLATSSIFVYGVDMAQGGKAEAVPLKANRQLQRNLDLRYAAIIYNPKLDAGKAQVKTQVFISRNGKIVFEEPEQTLSGPLTNNQIAKVGQLSLAKAQPGKYMLTLVVTDPMAGKKGIVVRSIDFNLID